MDLREESRAALVDGNREASSARAVVLVEGVSDKLALEALAVRHGRELSAERVDVLPMGGSKNIRHFLERLARRGFEGKVAGLCDSGEEGDFIRGLERAGFGSDLTRTGMERLGFFVCIVDLEDELIRALGAAAVERVIEAQGELGSFRTFQKQPAWRGRRTEDQLRRFFGSSRSRKSVYPPLIVAALDLARAPRPLEGILAHV